MGIDLLLEKLASDRSPCLGCNYTAEKRKQGTDEDTKVFVRWRVANNAMFSGGRTTNPLGYKKFLEERGLVGRVTIGYLKKKWENLKQKYDPPTGVSTEGGKATAASWKWFDLMHEAIGDRPSVTPPDVIATCAQGAVVFTPPSTTTPERENLGEAGQAAEDTATGSRVPTSSRRRPPPNSGGWPLWKPFRSSGAKMSRSGGGCKKRRREEWREAERARQAAEREEKEQRSSRDGAWRCCLPSWILLPCCSSHVNHAVLGVQHANVVEDGAAQDDLRDEQDVHLQRLQKDGPPPGLQDPEGPLHHSSGLCQPAVSESAAGGFTRTWKPSVLPATLLKAADPARRAKPAPTVTNSLLCGMVDGLGKEGGYLAIGGVDGTVDGCPRHVECPGDDTVGGSTGQPEQEHQAGDFRIPAVVCFSPYGFHQGIERSPGQSEVNPQVTLAIKKQPY
ncbi:hypothetical protein N1851_032918 [Merluccius polli]|uniref:Myb/SANT-like domain-containing protein n=1 Tax=Merluccius polli TaxID=89951 RepID=A0AA47M2G6_MERPO|nr:hypothetical protein N1851_032918 [Merluccius polli]